MIALLLIAALISQGIPLPVSETGTVTGTLKTELGTPAVGVRVGAMAKPESVADAVGGTALASIAETDAAGHFRLENIPPGRYYISAGRVDFPTFFPGTQLMTAGTAIQVKPGETISGIEFVLNPVAIRPLDSGSATPSLGFAINIGVAGGSKVPIYSAQGFAAVQLTRTSDGAVSTFPLASAINVTIPSVAATTPEYRIALQNLPEGYSVGSMVYGTTPITNSTVKIVSSPTAGARTAVTGTISGGLLTVASFTVGSPVTITLVNHPPSATNPGVRVTGSAPTAEPRSIYLSGVPGIFYSDGSFEFSNVKPGRYAIATPDNPLSSRPLAASIVVGNQNLDGVELVATPLLPKGIQTPTALQALGERSPGFTIPQGVIHGLVLDESTHQPIPEGTVYLTGHYGSSRSLVPDGRFEFTRLLPGSYDLEVQVFGHETIRRTIVVDDEDVTLDLSAAPIP